MLPMTKVEGAQDRAAAKPGMAFFAGTGPFGKTCGDCAHRGYRRESARGHWDEKLQTEVHRSYRVQKCEMFKKMAGYHGSDVSADNGACKYFEQKSK
jgi:hypothetical protein